MTRRGRQRMVGAVAGAVMVAAGLVGVTAAGTPVPTAAAQGEGEMPTALDGHLAGLRQTVPGNAGMSPDGPGSAAEQEFAARAYPADTIELTKSRAAVAAFDAVRTRTAAAAAAAKAGATESASAAAATVAGRWTNIGPSIAVYPFTRFRNAGNYVPNTYVAGGRTTSLTLSNVCRPGDCRMWITPAGGGVWRTEDALVGDPQWTYLGGPLGINAAGDVSVDPNDPNGDTIYVGTGEANICGSGCVAGVGMYKSTDGGDTWTGPLGGDVLSGKGFGDIIVKPGDPRTIYAATTTALRGHSSVCCDGVTRPVPDAAKWGLYKSTDAGRTWRFIHNGTRNPAQCTGSQTEFANNGPCSPRGVRHLVLDPSNPDILYASSYARGVWRSSDGGASWTRIKESLNPLQTTTRAAIDVTKLANGKTRMYVYEGNIGDPYARLFRSDDVATGRPSFRDLTSDDPADPGYATYDQCNGQCWYDLFVHTPDGHPDIVYTGGSYVYGETGGISNGRGVVLSTDAGVSGTDMTMDGTDPVHPNGLHPDQHEMVTPPGRPFRFFVANDGGVMSGNGNFVNRSGWCNDRGLEGAALRRCRQLLSRIPARLDGHNKGLSTLQFQHIEASPHDVNLLMGGTQDNGTWDNRNGNRRTWFNIMIGDGGRAVFDRENPNVRWHTFFNASPEVNFDDGDIADWIWTADPIFGIPGTQFYIPINSDPRVSGTAYVGTGYTVHRTKTFGLGDRTIREAQKICNTWTGTFEETCGDWEELGPTQLTSNQWGTRDGGAVAAIERTNADTRSAWAGTTRGRLFVSKNALAEPASAVRWTRIDTPYTPNRFVSSIYIDPDNGNRAWVSFSGYNATTPLTRGHVFQVDYDPSTGKAQWTDMSYDLDDIPITDLVRDDHTGDLYASSDFGVMRLPAGTRSWMTGGEGLPNVAVPGLTIRPQERILYAATHGLSIWRLDLGR